MVTTNDYKTDNKAYKWMYISIWLFIIVLVLNIWFYFYNSSLTSKVKNFDDEVVKVENNIKEINNDDKVMLYTLIQANKIFLDKYVYLSKIPEFINNLNELSKTFKVKFENFSYGNSTVNTSVIAIDDWISLWYQKSKKLIWSFRDKSVDNKQLFSLSFIDFIDWQNEMRFNAKFKIK